MKKIALFVLVLCMVLTFAACARQESTPAETTAPETTAPESTTEITLQEIFDANQTEALFENHQSVYIQDEMDGEVWSEKYLTKDYVFHYIPGGEFDWVEFMTDDACYYYSTGDKLLYLYITPDGVGTFANDRADRSELVIFDADPEDETIESASENDGRITVKGSVGQEVLADMAEDGLTSITFEYALDAKTHEMISHTSDYSYDDGTTFHVATKMTYDGEEPELLKTFLAYETQTENLRNVTLVSNPGTEKEETHSIQAPMGLIIGFQFSDEFENAVEFYTDAACTEAYDPYADTDSDLTVYVKWMV